MLTVGTNSYVSLDDANTYTAAQGLDSITDEAYLIQATKWIDRTFAKRFIGARQAIDQPLNWPRFVMIDSDGNLLNMNAVPNAVIEATVEAAIQFQNGVDMYVEPSPAVLEEWNELDVLKTRKYYAGSYKPKQAGDLNLYKIELILRPVLMSDRVKLMR